MPQPSVPKLALPEILDRRGASTLAQQIMAFRGQNLALDAGPVTRLGGLGAEVLIAARRQWQADGKELIVARWSDQARQALASFGLGPDLCSLGD